MVALMGFKLMNVCNRKTSTNFSLKTWLQSICLSIIPIVDEAYSCFVHSILFSSKFLQNGLIKFAKLKQFIRKYAILSNTAIKDVESEMASIKIILKTNLPNSLLMIMFKYYNKTITAFVGYI